MALNGLFCADVPLRNYSLTFHMITNNVYNALYKIIKLDDLE